MITCSNCKTQNDEGSLFCGECGSSLTVKTTTNDQTQKSIVEPIINSEAKKPDEIDVDYCLYNYKIDSLSNYSVAYNFMGDSLDEIEVQINTTSLDNGTTILNSLKKYYTDKYTAPLMDKGVYVFSCFDSKKHNFINSNCIMLHQMY